MFSCVEKDSPREKMLFVKALILCLLLAVLDQVTKELVIYFIPKFSLVTIIPGFFDLTYITNPGAAWGMFANKGLMLISISFFVMIGMLLFYRFLTEGWSERYYAIAMIISGILGNSYDRIFRSSYGKLCDGQVVDFLSFHIGDISWAVWPSFNVADSAICVGVGIFILSNFLRPEKTKNSAKNESEKAA